MSVYRMSEEYTNKTIKTLDYELRFRYNTQHDYFYFDLYTNSGTPLWLNNRVVNGAMYDTITFNSQYDYATIDNIESFSLVTDE